MVLVDSSVWINHFRSSSSKLSKLLEDELVLAHPMVIGELACGNLAKRKEIVALLHDLPSAPKADDDEVLYFIEEHQIMGKGLGLIDMHLLASCRLSGCRLWSDDLRLRKVARTLEVKTG